MEISKADPPYEDKKKFPNPRTTFSTLRTQVGRECGKRDPGEGVSLKSSWLADNFHLPKFDEGIFQGSLGDVWATFPGQGTEHTDAQPASDYQPTLPEAVCKMWTFPMEL